MNGKRSTGSSFTSASLMTLKELNKSHSKNCFSSLKTSNNQKLPKSANKKPPAKSFLAQVLSPDLNKSYASNLTTSSAAQFLPALNKRREKSKISIANTNSLVTSQNLNRLVEASAATVDLTGGPEMANIFNLKTVQQHELEQAELLEEKEKLKQEALNAENGGSDADDGQDNISYCSEATVEFCREATEYFLEDQNRVNNQNMFMSEPKFHRAFQVEPTAYLPSLKQLQNRKNTDAEDFYEPPGSRHYIRLFVPKFLAFN